MEEHPSDRVTAAVPELRVIDDELWSQGNARQMEMRRVKSSGDLTISRQKIEERILRKVREKLMRRDLSEEFCDFQQAQSCVHRRRRWSTTRLFMPGSVSIGAVPPP